MHSKEFVNTQLRQQKKRVASKQKKFLFFDLEMTGRNPKTDHIVQMSWYLTDDNGVGLFRRSYVIIPNGYVIPEEVVQIHGITTEVATKYGKPLEWVLSKFLKSWDDSWAVVGHNVWHDYRFLRKATKETFGKDISFKRMFDTCQLSTKFCQCRDKHGHLKSPSLQELFYTLFGSEYPSAHDAGIDTLACCRCFWELADRGVIAPDWHHTISGIKKVKQQQAQSAASKTRNKRNGGVKKQKSPAGQCF